MFILPSIFPCTVPPEMISYFPPRCPCVPCTSPLLIPPPPCTNVPALRRFVVGPLPLTSPPVTLQAPYFYCIPSTAKQTASTLTPCSALQECYPVMRTPRLLIQMYAVSWTASTTSGPPYPPSFFSRCVSLPVAAPHVPRQMWKVLAMGTPVNDSRPCSADLPVNGTKLTLLPLLLGQQHWPQQQHPKMGQFLAHEKTHTQPHVQHIISPSPSPSRLSVLALLASFPLSFRADLCLPECTGCGMWNVGSGL